MCHSLNPKAGSTRKEGYHTDKLNALPFYEGNACIYYMGDSGHFDYNRFIHLSEHVSFQPAAEQGLGFWKYKLNKSTDFVERAGVCGFPLPWMQEGLDRSGQPGAVVF